MGTWPSVKLKEQLAYPPPGPFFPGGGQVFRPLLNSEVGEHARPGRGWSRPRAQHFAREIEFPAVFGGIEASVFGGGLGSPGGTAEISRGQDRLGGRRPRYLRP